MTPESSSPHAQKGIQLPPHAYNLHGELLPEGYRFSKEDEARLDPQDFYTHRENSLLPAHEETEADRFMAWRWYGYFMVPCTPDRIGAMSWRIGRERQLAASLAENQRLVYVLMGIRRRIGLPDHENPNYAACMVVPAELEHYLQKLESVIEGIERCALGEINEASEEHS
jgi:hypothetical protein